MKAFKLIVTALICLAFTAPVYAVSGHVDMHYDFIAEEWTWGVGLERALGEHLAVGTALETMCPDYGYKGIVPSWIPEMQRYEVWAELRWRDISVKLIDWCNHYLAQSGIDDNDTHGLTLRVRYEF